VANRIKLAGTTSTSFQIGLQKVTLDTTQISSPYTLNLPSGTGSANQFLKTDGSGNLSWSNDFTYTLPTATTSVLGGVKIDGTTITIDGSGVIKANCPTLTTPRNINGVAFDGSADITITAAAGTLTGTTLKSTVVSSSLTSVGTLSSLGVTGGITIQNGDANPNFSKAQLTFGYNSTNDYPHWIHTTHNANASTSNAIHFYTSDGTQAGVFPTNGVLGLTITNGTISTGAITTTGTLALNASGGITTNQTTFPLVNTTATTVNFAGAATTISIGASTGNTTVNNNLIVTGTFTGGAPAGSLTGTTLKSTVVNSSLTSVGTLTNLTSAGTVIFTDTTNSTNTTTGALQVRGGVGVAGNIYLGGGINATGSIYSAGENVTYAPVTPTGQAYQATGKDTQGGTGYFDFFKINNTTSGGTNGSKTMRLNSVGTLEILNNAYNATILSVTDAGFIAINAASGVSNGVPANNAIAMNSNSYIYDDGNYHLTSKAGSIWLNANDGSAVNINTQMPSGITGGGLNVQGAVKSYGAGAAATAFISSGASLVSGVALQMDSGTAGTAANMAVRDTSTVASTMYFDVSTGGTPNGTFKFRSSNSFNELMVLNNTNATINRQMLIGGGSQTAYVTINGTNTYNISGSYGYLSGGGAGSIGSGGSTGNVGFSLYCSGRIQSNEVDVASDERLKDIQGTIPLDRALQFVRSIDGILYTWKPGFGDDGIKAGFGAQSVHKAGFDHMVAPVPNDRVEGTVDDDGWTHPDKVQLTVGYNQAIPYHHEVIKHLLDRIEQLEATVAKLAK